MLAGLALFFVGIQHLSSHLRQITGHKFRMLLQRATQSRSCRLRPVPCWAATMRTGSAITFILETLERIRDYLNHMRHTGIEWLKFRAEGSDRRRGICTDNARGNFPSIPETVR